MSPPIIKALPQFLETLGLDEEPMGIFYTDEKLAEGSKKDRKKREYLGRELTDRRP